MHTALADIRNAWRGDFADRALVDGRLPLTAEEVSELTAVAVEFRAEGRKISTLHRGGHRVAAGYETSIKQWTSLSRIFTLGDKRVFVLHKHATSWLLRIYVSLHKLKLGIFVHKPLWGNWKRRIQDRNLIPTLMWDAPDMVAMPFIDSVNARDLFYHRDDLQGLGESFSWVSTATRQDLLDVLTEVGAILATVHGAGFAWGDPVLENVIVTADRRVLLVDPETYYFGMRRAARIRHDLAQFIDSACAAFVISEGWHDRPAVESAVREGYR